MTWRNDQPQTLNLQHHPAEKMPLDMVSTPKPFLVSSPKKPPSSPAFGSPAFRRRRFAELSEKSGRATSASAACDGLRAEGLWISRGCLKTRVSGAWFWDEEKAYIQTEGMFSFQEPCFFWSQKTKKQGSGRRIHPKITLQGFGSSKDGNSEVWLAPAGSFKGPCIRLVSFCLFDI